MQEQIQEGGQGSSIQNGQKEQNMRRGKRGRGREGSRGGYLCSGMRTTKRKEDIPGGVRREVAMILRY